jgi:hypothetical protein
MPISLGTRRLRVALRALGIFSAFGLGAVAACLIAFSSSAKPIQLGVIAGLWSALLGAVAIYGVRRQHAPASPLGHVLAGGDATAGTDNDQPLPDLERSDFVVIAQALSEQLAQVSAEVTALRGELVQKVGGPMRHERVETADGIAADLGPVRPIV